MLKTVGQFLSYKVQHMVTIQPISPTLKYIPACSKNLIKHKKICVQILLEVLPRSAQAGNSHCILKR
jgi:hypothetical protein